MDAQAKRKYVRAPRDAGSDPDDLQVWRDKREQPARNRFEARLKTTGKRELKKSILRLQIYHAAFNRFRKQGYGNTRIEDIVRDLKIGQTTFFRYFPTKESLLDEYLRVVYIRLAKVYERQLSRNASTKECLVRLFEIAAAEMQADRRLWQAILFIGLSNPWRSPQARALDDSVRSFLEAIITKGQTRGDVRCSYPAAQLAQFIKGMITTVNLEWAGAPDNSYPLAERLQRMVAFFFTGANGDAAGA